MKCSLLNDQGTNVIIIIIIIIIIITNSYIAHFTITVSMHFTSVPWSLGQ